MYELTYLNWRTRQHGSLVVKANSFEQARALGEKNQDLEIFAIKRLFGLEDKVREGFAKDGLGRNMDTSRWEKNGGYALKQAWL